MIVLLGYAITDGRNYVSNQACNSIVTDYMRAYKWKTEEAANNVLKDAQNRKFMSMDTYYVEPIKAFVTPLNEETQDILYNIEALFTMYSDIKDSLKDLQCKLSTVDRKISDVEHFIEITDQNAVNGYKLYKKLKDLRIERRNIKRLIDIRQMFDKINIDNDSMKDIRERIESFKTRTFSPRELDLDKILGN